QEKLEQEKAYKEYEKHLAEQFAQSEDGEFEISDSESQELEYLKQTHQEIGSTDEN
ncbi:TPA: hypothetical protein RPW05_002093, partial [Campylobacter fetus subsp. venerealis]|nr:hypothetical protein [Campylobacter fetus subsp. venerealis]